MAQCSVLEKSSNAPAFFALLGFWHPPLLSKTAVDFETLVQHFVFGAMSYMLQNLKTCNFRTQNHFSKGLCLSIDILF